MQRIFACWCPSSNTDRKRGDKLILNGQQCLTNLRNDINPFSPSVTDLTFENLSYFRLSILSYQIIQTSFWDMYDNVAVAGRVSHLSEMSTGETLQSWHSPTCCLAHKKLRRFRTLSLKLLRTSKTESQNGSLCQSINVKNIQAHAMQKAKKHQDA